MTTAEPRKRTPLRVALLATLLGVIGVMTLFGGSSSQANSLTISCDGKGCIECNPSIQECPTPPPPAPTPEPVPTPTTEPTPPPPAPTPTPESKPETSVLAKTGASASNLTWIAVILAASGWGIWNKAQRRRNT